jgi:molybdopterin converting factor small subunit
MPGLSFFDESAIANAAKSLPYILLTMTVRVLLFASYADAVGRNELTLDIDEGSVVADVVSRVRQLAGGRALPPSPLLAVNASYAAATATVRSGDEVAIIPPVAGG